MLLAVGLFKAQVQVPGAGAGLGVACQLPFCFVFFQQPNRSWLCWLKMLLRMLCCHAAVLLCRSRAGDDGTQVQVAALHLQEHLQVR